MYHTKVTNKNFQDAAHIKTTDEEVEPASAY